jgi:hypothetical protein
MIGLGELIQQGSIQTATGDEIGKMAYGTGPIPFIRTSDISNWEIKAEVVKWLVEIFLSDSCLNSSRCRL